MGFINPGLTLTNNHAWWLQICLENHVHPCLGRWSPLTTIFVFRGVKPARYDTWWRLCSRLSAWIAAVIVAAIDTCCFIPLIIIDKPRFSRWVLPFTTIFTTIYCHALPLLVFMTITWSTTYLNYHDLIVMILFLFLKRITTIVI